MHSLPFLQGWQHGAFSHRMHILGAIRVGNNVTSHRTSHAHFNSKSSLTVALFSSFANMTMAGCQTNRANSSHYLGGFDVCGLRKPCVSKLRSLANKCEWSCACTKTPMTQFGPESVSPIKKDAQPPHPHTPPMTQFCPESVSSI